MFLKPTRYTHDLFLAIGGPGNLQTCSKTSLPFAGRIKTSEHMRTAPANQDYAVQRGKMSTTRALGSSTVKNVTTRLIKATGGCTKFTCYVKLHYAKASTPLVNSSQNMLLYAGSRVFEEHANLSIEHGVLAF